MNIKIIDRTQMRDKVDLNADDRPDDLFKTKEYLQKEGLESCSNLYYSEYLDLIDELYQIPSNLKSFIDYYKILYELDTAGSISIIWLNDSSIKQLIIIQ